MKHTVYTLTIAVFLITGLFSGCKQNSKLNDDLTKPHSNEEYESLLTTASEYLTSQQDSGQVVYDLGSYERWNYDQKIGIIEFSDSGVVKVRIKYEEVGSISKNTNTWLWAWANPHVLDQVKGNIAKVREYGESKKYERLTKATWEGNENDGWEMTAVSAYVLGAKGAYRIPLENTFLFILFMEIEDLR